MCIWRCQYHGNQEQVNKQYFSFALDQLLPPGWPCLSSFPGSSSDEQQCGCEGQINPVLPNLILVMVSHHSKSDPY